MNALAVKFRENKTEIDNLRRQLFIVRKTVRHKLAIEAFPNNAPKEV